MKLLQQRRNMIIPRSSVNNASLCIDSRLKPIELVCRQSSKNSVAVIQPCQDQRHNQSDKRLPANRATDAVKLTQYIKTPCDNLGNMCRHWQAAVNPNSRSRTTDAGWTQFPSMMMIQYAAQALFPFGDLYTNHWTTLQANCHTVAVTATNLIDIDQQAAAAEQNPLASAIAHILYLYQYINQPINQSEDSYLRLRVLWSRQFVHL